MPKQIASAFDIENARTMTRADVIGTFVPTDNFYSLISPKHHVVIGSRGSGKTAIAKMLSHSYLVGLADRGDERAQAAVREGKFVGIYISTRTEWYGTLKNKHWQTEEEQEQYFRWRLNVAACSALLVAFRSCLDAYVDDDLNRLRLERDTVGDLRDAWIPGIDVSGPSFMALHEAISDVDYAELVAVSTARTQGVAPAPRAGAFDADLFIPLRRGVELFLRRFELLRNATWAVCIDEAEVLDEVHQRILNSHLRADSDRLAFKITTLPYRHISLDTNAGVPIRVGHDFDYVYIDKRRTDAERDLFAERIFERVIIARAPEHHGETLRGVLGTSELLTAKASDWNPQGPEMKLLREHGTAALVNRAERLLRADPSQFRDAVTRKVHGLLLLRERARSEVGNTAIDYYSGAEMLVRCGDDNPRRIIRLLNAILSELDSSGSTVPNHKQSRQFVSYSTDVLDRTRSEPECGHELREFLRHIGRYMRSSLHDGKLTGDIVTAIKVDPVKDKVRWHLVERAVEWGLLLPKINTNNPNRLPEREGVFHLAYVLAPRFRLFPRRGKTVQLSTVVRWRPSDLAVPPPPDLWNQPDQ